MNMTSRLDLTTRGGRRERRDEGAGKGDQERGAGEEDKGGEPRECMTEMAGVM